MTLVHSRDGGGGDCLGEEGPIGDAQGHVNVFRMNHCFSLCRSKMDPRRNFLYRMGGARPA